MPRRLGKTIQEVELQPGIEECLVVTTPQSDNISDNSYLGIITSRTFPNPVMVRQYPEISKSERIRLGYYHLGGWAKYTTVVLDCDKASIPEDQG
jgi:hypothetical protein